VLPYGAAVTEDPFDVAADDDALAEAHAAERAQAVALFNHAWSLLDLPRRNAAEDFDLVHVAHASRWHWGRVGGPQEWAIGEWQCARVYAELVRPEGALAHANRCLALCREHELDGFIVASAHEALARAHLVAGELDSARAHRDRAAELAADLDDLEDRAVVEGDLATLPL
jgi:tetratricopeptide (TPR) repeat protein